MARTDRRRLSKNRELPILIAWAVSIVAFLMLINSAWTYLNISTLVKRSQEHSYSELAKGLSIAVSDVIVTRDYGELEASLRHALSNTSILQASVADRSGKVLATVRRNEKAQVVVSFEPTKLEIPSQLGTEPFIENEDGPRSKVWYAINPGVPMGWLYLEISDQVNDQILFSLRRDALVFTSVIFLIAIAIFSTVLGRMYRRIRAREYALEKQNDVLSDAAFHDPLTKLPNRMMYERSLENAVLIAIADDTLVALCFLDLDGFKAINDELGHDVGDQVLIKIAERLRIMLREYDSVIRLGGDEFVLILTGIKTRAEIQRLLDRIISVINTPLNLSGLSRHVGASIGVVLCPLKHYEPVALLTLADQTMYEAKKSGKNCWKFSHS